MIHRERAEPLASVAFHSAPAFPASACSSRALPSEVVTIYPAWRSYEHFRLRDQIEVVDRRSGEIVDVLPAGSSRLVRQKGGPHDLPFSLGTGG